jgi:hypothetical protein
MKIVNKNFPSNNSYFSKGNLYVYNFFYQGLSGDNNYEINVSFSFISNKNYETNYKFTLDDFIELSPTQENTNFMNGIFFNIDKSNSFIPIIMDISKNGFYIYATSIKTGLISSFIIDAEAISLVSKQTL